MSKHLFRAMVPKKDGDKLKWEECLYEWDESTGMLSDVGDGYQIGRLNHSIQVWDFISFNMGGTVFEIEVDGVRTYGDGR